MRSKKFGAKIMRMQKGPVVRRVWVICRDLANMYTDENWFEISFVVDILGTKFPKYLTLTNK